MRCLHPEAGLLGQVTCWWPSDVPLLDPSDGLGEEVRGEDTLRGAEALLTHPAALGSAGPGGALSVALTTTGPPALERAGRGHRGEAKTQG